MVKRNYNLDDKEPDQATFDIPSEKEHLFQVVDVFTSVESPFKAPLPDEVVVVKCEIVGGQEEGRTLLQRLSLDENWKGFFATRLFLKAIGEPHKGSIEIDTDKWIGRQFYATVVHNGKYANIGEYNFDKKIEQQYKAPVGEVKTPEDIIWDDK